MGFRAVKFTMYGGGPEKSCIENFFTCQVGTRITSGPLIITDYNQTRFVVFYSCIFVF